MDGPAIDSTVWFQVPASPPADDAVRPVARRGQHGADLDGRVDRLHRRGVLARRVRVRVGLLSAWLSASQPAP